MAELVTVGIIGGGAWGTALATVAARNNHRGMVWDINPDIGQSINRYHQHPFAFPDILLNENISGAENIEEVCKCPLILAAVPSQFMRETLARAERHIESEAIVALCAKGIEIDSGKLMSEVAETILPELSIVVLSGPTFAAEVATGLPTAITLAAENKTDASFVAEILGHHTFRPYLSNDLIGAQISGAAKNVLAIACGIASAKSLGQNAAAALITRGIAEIGRLSAAMGGSELSIMEPAGIGDIVLTCTSSQSRNFSFGHQVGQEKAEIPALIQSSGTVEGFMTAASITQLSQKYAVEMPIMKAVSDVLHNHAQIDYTISKLLTRLLEHSLN